MSRPWLRAGVWLAFLGPFFFASYGFANWWTSRLPHVPSLVLAWEKHIPFWEWSIVPYMSIDAFYALSLFLCTSRAELDTHAKRLLCATLISVTGFLLFPLQYTFVRPATSGWTGMLFEVLTGFDKPFNQAPSLHVSLLMLLWACYHRHLRGWPRWLMHCWFALIGISVFTTWQHHVIDGVWGVAVGVLCFYLFPQQGSHALTTEQNPLRRMDWARRRDLARRYLAGALLCWATACYLRGWGWWLLWPMLSLLLVALAYARTGVAAFQKQGGRQRMAAHVLLAPYRLGAWLASRWFSRHDRARVQVVPGLFIGRAPGPADWPAPGVAALLDLTAEFNTSARGLPYASVPMLDLVVPSLAQLQQAIAALQSLQQQLAQTGQAAPRGMLIHCALGYSRSALVAAAWLLQTGHCATPAQAVACVRMARPRIVLPPASLALLDLFHQHLATAPGSAH